MSSRLVRRMSVSSLVRRVNALDQKFHPAPLIVDANKARNELLMMLEMQMALDEDEEETELTPEDELFAQEFSAFLDEKANWIQETCNIKLV